MPKRYLAVRLRADTFNSPENQLTPSAPKTVDVAALRRQLMDAKDARSQLEACSQLLTTAQIADAVRVSTETLRLWRKGGTVRETNREALASLRMVVLRLLPEGAEAPQAVVDWLTMPTAGSSDRPLDLVRDRSATVLAAASSYVAGRQAEAAGILARNPTARPGDANSSISTGPTEPSSTQVIANIAGDLLSSTGRQVASDDVRSMLDRLEKDLLPNYLAPRRLIEDIREELKLATRPPDVIVRDAVRRHTQIEEETEACFRKWGEVNLRGSEAILTYALSMRVIQALRGAEHDHQATTVLFVAECRVKSAPPLGDLTSFGDGAQIFRYLDRTRYDRCLVFDIDAAERLRKLGAGRVDRLMLGAQRVIERPGRPKQIVATAGTGLLLELARRSGIEINVLAETAKSTERQTAETSEARPWVRGDHQNVVLPDGDDYELAAPKDELCRLLDGELVTERWEKTSDAEAVVACANA